MRISKARAMSESETNSSATTTRGCCKSVRAMATRWRCPPLRRNTFSLVLSAMPMSSMAARALLNLGLEEIDRAVLAVAAPPQRSHQDVFQGGQIAHQSELLGDVADERGKRALGLVGNPCDRGPRYARGLGSESRPLILSKVVLPYTDGPMSMVILPVGAGRQTFFSTQSASR